MIVENLGKLDMRVDGVVTKRAVLTGTHVIEIVGCASFLYSMRPARMTMRVPNYPVGAFGEADGLGFVGEGPEIWRLRALIAFVAAFDEHVLIHGETGAGKELTARGIHALSRRAGARFVDCNVAAIAETLVGLVLGGNRKDYPNVGTPEREGLLAAAAKGTLLLDEVGEVAHDVLAAFLRAMDPNASYHRMGDPHPSFANVRFIVSTNRELAQVKRDFIERCPHRIPLPSLNARREDIPLIARHLLLAAAGVDGSPAKRFVRTDKTRRPEMRIEQALMTALVRAHYTGNVRELARMLRDAMAVSPGTTICLPPSRATIAEPGPVAQLTEAGALAAIARHGGNVSAAARELGVSRDVLRGLVGKRK